MKKLLLIVMLTGIFINSRAQEVVMPADSTQKNTTITQVPADSVKSDTKSKKPSMYCFNLWADIPITAVAAGWSAFAFSHIYSKTPSTPEQIMALDKNDIPKIDRWAAGMSDENADATSDYFFYGSIPVPLFLFLDKKMRKDALKISFLYLEAMSITGMFYTGTVYFVDRYRPETYDTNIPVESRLSGNYKDAFLAGHPALVATGLFFTAKVYGDYNPDKAFKWVLYSVAIAGTGATVYLRHKAGKHFPTDLLTGVTLGTLSGILVPHFHKNKDLNKPNMSLLPYFNGDTKGIYFAYKF